MANLRNSVENLIPDSMDNRMQYYTDSIVHQYAKFKKNIHEFLADHKAYETIDETMKYLMAHPILFGACLSMIAAFVVPIFLFILFIVVNIAFAFTGFLVVEVAVLGVGATVLCGVIFLLLSTVTVLGIFCVITWTLTTYILTLLKSIKNKTVHHKNS